ncbi:MAG: manganese efflux pump MntP family protein [Bacillales bacterium]|nr:manganese efflux pump MntP family protein [Bacillales bacterium]
MGFINVITAIGLGIGLAMDACAVSMSNGLSEPNMKLRKIFLIASFFGFFQMIMPVFGYLGVTLLNTLFEKYIQIFEYCVPWIALIILGFLGIKMLVEGIKEGKENVNEEKEKKSLTIGVLFVQAIATSIDALSVGIIYGETPALEAYITFAIVGVVTFAISVGAIFIGKKFGTIFSNKATIAGGIILCAIGIEIFFTHWSDVVGSIQAIRSLFL